MNMLFTKLNCDGADLCVIKTSGLSHMLCSHDTSNRLQTDLAPIDLNCLHETSKQIFLNTYFIIYIL